MKTKFIQIAINVNQLFALDDEGRVWEFVAKKAGHSDYWLRCETDDREEKKEWE